MFQFLQQLNFGHRLTLYRLVIALGLAGMIYWAFYVPKSGDRAMRRAAAAVQKARSWKVQWTNSPLEADFKLEYLVEVSCPSSSRVIERTIPNEGSRRVEATNVFLAMDGQVYLHSDRENAWSLTAPGNIPYAGDCAALSRHEDTTLLPPFRRYERRGSTRKGEVREVGGERCREWEVVIFYNTNSPTENYKVCLGVDDDLPRSHTANGVEFRYFDWNVPIQFTVLQLVQESKP